MKKYSFLRFFKYTFSFLFIVQSLQLFGQETEKDSMLRLMKYERDSARVVELLNEIGWELKVSQPDSAKAYLKRSIEIAERKELWDAQADAYNYIGILESIRGNVDEASDNWEASLQIRIDIEDKKGQAKIYNNLGILYKNKNDFTKAIQYYRQAELIYEDLNNMHHTLNPLNPHQFDPQPELRQ